MNPYFQDPRSQRSEALVFQAEHAARRGDAGAARDLYLEAAALLEAVVAEIPAETFPNTRRDLAASAAACRERAAGLA